MAYDTNVVVVQGACVSKGDVKMVGAKNTKKIQLRIVVGGYGDKKNFFDVDVWGATVDVVEKYVDKGKQMIINGELAQDTWETDGQKRSKVYIKANNINLLGGGNNKPNGKSPKRDQPQQTRNDDVDEPFDEDQFGEDQIPF